MNLNLEEVKDAINNWHFQNKLSTPIISSVIPRKNHETLMSLYRRTKAPIKDEYWVIELNDGLTFFVNDVTGKVHDGKCSSCLNEGMPEDCIICWLRARKDKKKYNDLVLYGFNKANYKFLLRTYYTPIKEVELILCKQLDGVEIFENEELIYIDEGYVGCNGFLIKKDSKTWHTISSSTFIPELLWAWHNGISFWGQKQNVEITNLLDSEESINHFRNSFFNIGNVDLSSKIIKLKDQELYLRKKELMIASKNNYFSFKVDPYWLPEMLTGSM